MALRRKIHDGLYVDENGFYTDEDGDPLASPNSSGAVAEALAMLDALAGG
jgi:hypothetical protein